MKQLRLAKYGFIRRPEEDFSDDGSRFEVYSVGRVRVTKLVSEGIVYLSGRIERGLLNYDQYGKLPHYDQVTWKLNGKCSLDSLVDKDIEEFYYDCVKYEQEYKEVESTIHVPTDEEIASKEAQEKEILDEEKEFVKSIALTELFTLNEWTQKIVLKYAQQIMKRKVDKEFHRRSDMNRVAYMDHTIEHSFYYDEIKELLKR